jgi:phosphopentomutase
MKPFKRVIWIVLDGVGVGEAPDAARFGDLGSNTLGNLSKKRPLKIPTLLNMGMGTLTAVNSLDHIQPSRGIATKASELSEGKDTTSGHWEMTGVPVFDAFSTFPNGFSDDVVSEWCKACNLNGVLGNTSASGTEIIDRLGPEHIQTGKPILYTSADSVWQIAAHETYFGLNRLYEISKEARKICDRLNISRVIARPFVGEVGNFKRTYNRKDYAQDPPKPTLLSFLQQKGVPILGIGKISNIFAGHGVTKNIDTQGNTDGMRVLAESIQKESTGLIYINLIDFDMLYGHRRDVEGFATALEEFDHMFAPIVKSLGEDDLIVITADHGNDPTYKGTDHTREFVPILLDSARFKDFKQMGIRTSFADCGITVGHALLGDSFLTEPHSLTGTSIF